MKPELKLGFMTTAELAQWANNKSLANLTNKKKEWCKKQLSKYAEFELVAGGVIITKIIEPVWKKSARQTVNNNWFNYYGHDDIKADTCINCFRKMRQDFPDLQISEKTGGSYVGTFRGENFGYVKGKRKGQEGIKGLCKFAFGKVIDNEFYFFNAEEEKIKKKLEQKYFQQANMEVVYEIQAATELFTKGEITQEEFNERVIEASNNKNWVDFKYELMEKIEAEVDFRVLLTERHWEIDPAPSNGSFEF